MRYALAGLFALVALPARAAEPLPENAVARLGTTKFRVPASSVALSPDGKSAAFRVPDGIDVMNLDTGEVAARLRDAKKLTDPKWSRGPHGFSFAFAPGGKEIVTAAATTEVWVWDAGAGTPLRSVPGPEREVAVQGGWKTETALVYTVFNCQLAGFVVCETGAGWQKLDPKTGKWSRIEGGVGRISDVSPDGRWVADYEDQASVENYVALTDTTTNKGVYAGESGGSYPHNQTPSPDGRYVACEVEERGVQVWEVATRKEVKLKGVNPKISHGVPRFAPDGKTLVVHLPGSTYDDKTPPHVARWDVATGERLPDWKLPARVGPWAVDHPNNRLVLVAGQGVFRIDLATGKITAPPDGFLGYVRPAISADGKLAAVGDSTGVVRLYAAPFDAEPRTLQAGGPPVDDVLFAPDGKTLFAADADRAVGVWDVATGRKTAALKGPVGRADTLFWYRMTKLAVSPDGKTLVAEAGMQAVWAWDVPSGKLLWVVRPAGEKDRSITGCRPAFSPDGSVLYYGRDKAEVSKFDPRTGRELGRVVVPGVPKRDVTRVAVSPDGKKLAASTYHNDGYLVVLDPATGSGTFPVMFKLEEAVGGLAFAAGGAVVVTNHADGTVRGRRADAPGKEAFTLRGPAGYSAQLQLTADGKLAIADAPGATAVVWKLPVK